MTKGTKVRLRPGLYEASSVFDQFRFSKANIHFIFNMISKLINYQFDTVSVSITEIKLFYLFMYLISTNVMFVFNLKE